MTALIVLIAACLTAEFFWWVVAIITAGFVIKMIIKAANTANDRDIARIKRRRELAARADQQDQWYIEGDSRGTYGQYPPVTVG